MSLTFRTAYQGLNVAGGLLQFIQSLRHSPDPVTTSEMAGIRIKPRSQSFSQNLANAKSGDIPAGLARLNLSKPGQAAFGEASPFGGWVPQGQPMDPDALQTSLIEDTGNIFRAAQKERDRALEWGRKYVEKLDTVEAEGQERLRQFQTFRDSVTTTFRTAKHYTNALFGYARNLPGNIMQSVKTAQADIISLYDATRDMARDALSQAGMEVASLMNGIREGIDRNTEDHKTQTAARLASMGWDNESIRVALNNIDYEKGSVLMSSLGAVADQQLQRLGDLFSNLTATVGQAGAAAGSQLTQLTEAGVSGRVAAGNLMSTATDTMNRVSDLESRLKLDSLVAESSYATNLDALRAQGMFNAAGFFAAIQEPVLATSQIHLMMNSIWQSLAGEDNAAQMSLLQSALMPGQMLQNTAMSGFPGLRQPQGSSSGGLGGQLGSAGLGAAGAIGAATILAAGFCISGDSVVVTTEGPKTLRDLRVGDSIHVPSGDMRRVIGKHLGLFRGTSDTRFYRIWSSDGRTLVATGDHIVDGVPVAEWPAELRQEHPVVEAGDVLLEDGGPYFANGFVVTPMISMSDLPHLRRLEPQNNPVTEENTEVLGKDQ